MTETLARPPAAEPLSPSPRRWDRTALTAGASAAGGAAVRGLALAGALTAVMWWAEDRSGTAFADAARAAGQLWVAAHGAALDAPHGRLGLTPLGLPLVALLLSRSAGRRAADAVPARPWLLVAAVVVPYTALVTAVAIVTGTTSLRPVPSTAGLGALAVAGAGAAAGTGALGGVRRWASGRLVPVLVAGAAAVATLLAAAAALVALALAMDAGTAAELARATEPGAVGGLGLALLGVALVPNAVVCAAAWLTGPGFAVGTATSVTPFGTDLGPVPGLPLMAALPGGAPPAWAPLVLLLPVLAGAVAGRLLHRRVAVDASRSSVAGDVAATALVAGLALAVLADRAGGSLGDGHLATVGPSAWRVGAALAVEVAVGAGAVVAVLRGRATPAA